MQLSLENLYTIFDKNQDKDLLTSIEGNPLTYHEMRTKAAELGQKIFQKAKKENIRVAIICNDRLNYLTAYLCCILEQFSFLPLNENLCKDHKDIILEQYRPNIIIDDLDVHAFNNTEEPSIKPEITFFTSGTTGLPKGYVHSIEALINSANDMLMHLEIKKPIRMLHVMPIGYMAGFLNTIIMPLLTGGSIVLEEQFSPAIGMAFWKNCIQKNIDTFWLTPTMLSLVNKFTRSPSDVEWIRQNIRYPLVATAKLKEKLFDEVKENLGIIPLETYGLTEMLFLSANKHEKYRRGSVGQLLPNISLDINKVTNELNVRSPYLAEKEISLVESEVKIFDRNSSFSTGDVGAIDSEGFLIISDRLKDIVKVGGVRISPRYIEEKLLLQCNEIEDIAVVGVDSEFWGEELVAYIILKPGNSEKSIIKIQENSKACLPKDHQPSHYRMIDKFPYSSTGKVDKRTLKKGFQVN